jgi:type I restriction-modification system DNA methylase subunit
MQHNRRAGDSATLSNFKIELTRLVEQFRRNLSHYKEKNHYDEASLRNEYLNPLFRALGWDVENRAGLIPKHREVEIESRTKIAGRKKRADYLFRIDRTDRFICEAKKPAEELHAGYAYQAKRYAWNKGLVLAVLTDFEEMKIYVVGSKPQPDELNVGLWKTYHFEQYLEAAQEIWNLLSRPAIADNSIEKLIETLPKKPATKGKARQQWLFKPDRTRALDVDFLNFLDEVRRTLAQDLLDNNDRKSLLEGGQLNEAVQRILDRLLFLRICEDRDIDTGYPLAIIMKSWREETGAPSPKKARQTELSVMEERKEIHPKRHREISFSLWREVVAHIRALDRRPPKDTPYFNGNLFKQHFSEDLQISDKWISEFLEEIGDDESPYLFNVIPVEILGTIYERFLGKVVRPHGNGAVIEEKPEVRKAGGVYYTPRYIVDYIVEQTVGKLLENTTPKDSLKLKILDPACGSGSFLIRAFERICEYWQAEFMKDEKLRRNRDCWIDPDTKDIHLTTELKRRILTSNIYGVDIDPGAVEVTQLSLYLKMLEGENRTTLARERELFGGEKAILPPLENNIKCGNSLISSDYSVMPDDLVEINAFDWPMQFKEIINKGGFDIVIGNPPYVYGRDWAELGIGDEQKKYFMHNYTASPYQLDYFSLFMERAIWLTAKGGVVSQIVPNVWLTNQYSKITRKYILSKLGGLIITIAPSNAFEGIIVDTVIYTGVKELSTEKFIISKISPNEVSFIGSLPYNEYNNGNLPISSNANTNSVNLIKKLFKQHPKLGELAEITRGVHPYRDDGYGESAYTKGYQIKKDVEERPYHSKKPKKGWRPFIYGKDLVRYSFPSHTEYVKYGKWLAEPRSPYFFEGPRIYSRKILGERLIVTYEDKNSIADQQIYITKPIDTNYPVKYILGILGSKLIAYFIRTHYDECTKLFPQIKISQLREIPIAVASNNLHKENLIAAVDKMLSLISKLETTKLGHEKSIIQNAITTNEHQIDKLVYELYGLTKEEITLVEKG